MGLAPTKAPPVVTPNLLLEYSHSSMNMQPRSPSNSPHPNKCPLAHNSTIIMKKIVLLLAFIAIPMLSPAKDKAKPALPNATLSDVQWGTQVNEAAFKKEELAGKVVVVEEWGVKCPPCIASLPHMAKLAKSNDKKGLVVVGLERQGSTKEDILKVLKTARVEFPVMSGGSAPGNTGGIPHVVVFDVTGKLIFNGHPADDDFERTVKKALKDVKKS